MKTNICLCHFCKKDKKLWDRLGKKEFCSWVCATRYLWQKNIKQPKIIKKEGVKKISCHYCRESHYPTEKIGTNLFCSERCSMLHGIKEGFVSMKKAVRTMSKHGEKDRAA